MLGEEELQDLGARARITAAFSQLREAMEGMARAFEDLAATFRDWASYPATWCFERCWLDQLNGRARTRWCSVCELAEAHWWICHWRSSGHVAGILARLWPTRPDVQGAVLGWLVERGWVEDRAGPFSPEPRCCGQDMEPRLTERVMECATCGRLAADVKAGPVNILGPLRWRWQRLPAWIRAQFKIGRGPAC